MKYVYILFSVFLFVSCEDVIDLPLTEGPKRLIIDANINWYKGTDGKLQRIKLMETVGFYERFIPPANNATVKITDSNSNEYIFIEDGNSGIYRISNFTPKLEETYTLNILYNGETYTATETLKSITDITGVEQTEENIFGTEAIRIDFKYKDPADEENYYLEEFSAEAFSINSLGTWPDKFINGNEDTSFYIDGDEELEKGDILTHRFYGVSENFQNYMSLLLEQTDNQGPFGTPPAAVKGNCINTTNPEKKPLGYFRLSEVVQTDYIIQ